MLHHLLCCALFAHCSHGVIAHHVPTAHGIYGGIIETSRPQALHGLISGACAVQLSKKCPFVIKTNQNPVAGNVTWKIPNTVPFATYSLRAFVYRNVTQANGMNISQPLATGVSVGYFQVLQLCDTETCCG